MKAALEAKVSPLGHAARRRRAGKPVVVFTLGGEYDIDWPLNTTSAKRGRSSSSWLQKGIQSGILQKVEIQNHDESLSAACKLFPTPTFSVEGRRELETRQKLRLGCVRWGVSVAPGSRGERSQRDKRVTLKAELKTPVGLNVSGEVSPLSGLRRIFLSVEVKPRLVHRGFGLMSSGISATTYAQADSRMSTSKPHPKRPPSSHQLHHEVSLTFQQARLVSPSRHHLKVASSSPMPPRERERERERASGAAGAHATSASTRKEVALVGGHWIDPGKDTGAPGEREMNMHIANRVTSKLASEGWIVWRPENNTAGYTWDQYLDWVGDQTTRNVPVIEIHGQGRIGNVPALGVIGDRNAPLNRVFGKWFGFFPMDYTLRGVPRHGGTILEAFDTDRFRGLNPLERYKAAEAVSETIASRIRQFQLAEETNSNRSSSGVLAGCSCTGCPVDKRYLEKRGLEAKSYRHR